MVATLTHTPRFWGQDIKAGDLDFCRAFSRPLRTSWFNVGKGFLPRLVRKHHGSAAFGPGLRGKKKAKTRKSVFAFGRLRYPTRVPSERKHPVRSLVEAKTSMLTLGKATFEKPLPKGGFPP